MNKIIESIRTIPDFPKKGIMFRDVTTLFSNPPAFQETINEICNYWKNKNLTKIIGIEARGFIIGSSVSLNLGCHLYQLEKKGNFHTILLKKVMNLSTEKQQLKYTLMH